MQKMARRHSKEEGNHLEQEINRQNAAEDIDGGLHPAVDGQSLGEKMCKLKPRFSVSFTLHLFHEFGQRCFGSG